MCDIVVSKYMFGLAKLYLSYFSFISATRTLVI